MTADGRRHCNGSNVLWSIIKTREPKAYKEIMNRAKEFEKQFRQHNIKREPEPEQNKALLKKQPLLSLIRPLVFQMVLSLSPRSKVTQAIPMVLRIVYLFILGSGCQSHMMIFLEKI